jgi:hypothetical protein
MKKLLLAVVVVSIFTTGCTALGGATNQSNAGGSSFCTPPNNPAGTKMGILNMPSNKMHGKTVCARPGDTNISKWLE